MASGTKNKLVLPIWLRKNKKDPACEVSPKATMVEHVWHSKYEQNFLPKLKSHLLTRLRGLEYDGDEQEYSTAERNQVMIKGDVIYQHKKLCINYTTYDMRRDQDSLNIRNNADFMVLGCECEADSDHWHPYWYGRIIGIYHANIDYLGPGPCSLNPQKMEFLWVHWPGRDPNNGYHEGWKRQCLPWGWLHALWRQCCLWISQSSPHHLSHSSHSLLCPWLDDTSSPQTVYLSPCWRKRWRLGYVLCMCISIYDTFCCDKNNKLSIIKKKNIKTKEN